MEKPWNYASSKKKEGDHHQLAQNNLFCTFLTLFFFARPENGHLGRKEVMHMASALSINLLLSHAAHQPADPNKSNINWRSWSGPVFGP